jgi:hypothetical protein
MRIMRSFRMESKPLLLPRGIICPPEDLDSAITAVTFGSDYFFPIMG